MLFCVFTRAEAPQFAKLAMFLFDLPVKGTHVGGGIHVPMPDTAPNPCPFSLAGWSTRPFQWIANNSNTGAAGDLFAVRVTQQIQDLWQAKKSQLTPGQRTFVQNHLDSAADLSADPAWQTTVQGQQVLVEGVDFVPDP